MIALDLHLPQFGEKGNLVPRILSKEEREPWEEDWEKAERKSANKVSREGVWGRESPLLGSLCSPIFLLLHSVFAFIPHYGAWSQANLRLFFPALYIFLNKAELSVANY